MSGATAIRSEPKWESIPAEMAALPRWVLWRETAAGAKIPFCPQRGKPIAITERAAGCSLARARAAYIAGEWSGIGFILAGQGVVAVDLDDCIECGAPNVIGRAVLREFPGAYVEISPSGKGLHVFGLSSDERSAVLNLGPMRVELYATKRFMTVTGRLLDSSPGICVFGSLPGYTRLLDDAQVVRELEIASTRFTQEAQDDHAEQGEQEGQEDQDEQEQQDVQEDQDLQEAQAPQAAQAEQKHTEEEAIGRFAAKNWDRQNGQFPVSCMPNGTGVRHRSIFQSARFLRQEMPGAGEDEIYPVYLRWHALAVPFIRTKDVGTSWAELLVALDRVKSPLGETLEQALLNGPELPLWMREHRFGDLGTQLLLYCVALASHHAPEPFFVSTRVAAQHLNCSHTTVATLLTSFSQCGYLVRVDEGSRARRRAATYLLGNSRKDAVLPRSGRHIQASSTVAAPGAPPSWPGSSQRLG